MTLVTPATREVAVETALTTALLQGLGAMNLTEGPVEHVVETKRGRPVRYDAGRRTVFVNVAHETLRGLAKHPARNVLLMAAAVSEINRELVPVTDAEELKVIVDLLRDG